MTNKIVYTVITGSNQDHKLRLPKYRNDDWMHICFTDRQGLQSPCWPENGRPAWKIEHFSNIEKLHPAVLSRKPKILAHDYLDPMCELSLYLDCRFTIMENLNLIIEEFLPDHTYEIAVMKHNKRDCIYDEAKELNISDEPFMERYRMSGIKSHSGLWAPGIMMRIHSQKMTDFNELWWTEFWAIRTTRDQIPLAYSFYKMPMGLHELDFRSTYDRFMDKIDSADKADKNGDSSHDTGNKSDNVPVQSKPAEVGDIPRKRGRPRGH